MGTFRSNLRGIIHTKRLSLLLLTAGSSSGLASPPMGEAVATAIAEESQDRANALINSGTSIGVALSGPASLLLTEQWRIAWGAFALVAARRKAGLRSRLGSPPSSRAPRASPLRWQSTPSARTRTHSLREILNAVFYLLKSGCQWRLLPHDFPRWPTVYHYFRTWRIDGTWERINRAIRQRLRVRLNRDPQPSAGVVDSQGRSRAPQ